MRRIISIAVAFVGVLVFGAIVAVIVFTALRTPPADLTQPTWTLTQLVVDDQEVTLSPTHSATLHFGAHDSQVFGSRDCIMFSGSYSLHGNQVHLELGGNISDIGCPEPFVAGQQSHYFQALPRIQTYQIVGTTLTLRGDSDRVHLTFHAS